VYVCACPALVPAFGTMEDESAANRKMTKIKNIGLIFFILFLLQGRVIAQSFEHKGQISGWVTSHFNDVSATQAGLRYIPEFMIQNQISEDHQLDASCALNIMGSGLFNDGEVKDWESSIKPYRVWARFAGTQFEFRAGLQKINFGSATLLRPLMWFDRIDPRDPLQLTDGVYGLLFRYYFLNNANIWLWGLAANNKTKGWESLPSDSENPEYGGRIQVPVYTGEIALSFHQRKIDLTRHPLFSFLVFDDSCDEHRFGLDGKWDIGIGIWFEGSLVYQNVNFTELRYQRLFTVGFDYTFDIGQGLHLLGEHFTAQTTKQALGSGEGISFSALSLNYSFGLIDNLTGIIYYDWENEEWYRFVSWRRTYDKWQFIFNAFWNPDQFQLRQGGQDQSLSGGKGIQVMAVFNY